MYLSKIMKEPLVHFLAIGAILLAILSAVSPAPQGERIFVDRAALLSFIQYRSKAFEAGAAASVFDHMTSFERDRLIDDFVREEALYREARALGLDKSDYIIRKRMVQKLEFMSEASLPVQLPNEEELRDYYAGNKEDYYQQAGITFTHVFVSAKTHGMEEAKTEATRLIDQLQGEGADFADATGYGERFLYHTNYVDRAYDYVKSHFGVPSTDIIFSDKLPLFEWYGPIISQYGAHLVFVTERTSGETLPFSTLRARIMQDITRDRLRANTEGLIDEIIGEYIPVIASDISANLPDPLHTGE